MPRIAKQLVEAPGHTPKSVWFETQYPLLPLKAGKRGGGKGVRFRIRGLLVPKSLPGILLCV